MRLLLLAAALLATPGFAGSASHGGDRHLDEDNPWFLTAGSAPPQPVGVCVTQGAAPATDEQHAMVAGALAKWTDFFRKYGLDKAAFTDVVRAVHHATPPLPVGTSALRLNLAFASASGADCDLTVVFEAAQSAALGEQRMGQADRGERRGEWSYRGVVRVRAIDDASIVRHVLLHELGHAFGMPHNSLAIMDENTVDRAVRHVEFDLEAIETAAWKMVLRPGDTLDFNAHDVCNGEPGMGTQWHHTFLALRKLLELPTTDICLGFTLEYLKKVTIPFGGYLRELRLTVTAPGGATAVLNGVARITETSYAGPGVYAAYKGGSFEPAVFVTKRYTTMFDDGYLTEGYFELGDVKLPMSVSFYRGPDLQTGPGEVPSLGGDKGPRLKLFNPQTSEWTTIQ